jgi:hypothetical protein
LEDLDVAVYTRVIGQENVDPISAPTLAHSAVVTAANVHDKHPSPDLPHGNERRVYGDSAYSIQQDLIVSKALRAKDRTTQALESWVRILAALTQSTEPAAPKGQPHAVPPTRTRVRRPL